MVEDVTFNKWLKFHETTRARYELGLIAFEDRNVYIEQRILLDSYVFDGKIYNRKNITPFTIPLFYLN